VRPAIENVLNMHGKALWYVAPGRAELRDEPLAAPKSDEVRVRALYGAISRGTERLVHAGRVPASEYDRMRAPMMGGAFPFPVKYGYATVGRVEAGPAELAGRTVFSLHPHQSLFNLPAEAVTAVPANVPPARAVMAANMETALNAVWDGAPGPADRVAVVGGGLLGLLVAYLCARLPGADVTVVDIAPSRSALARAVGANFSAPDVARADEPGSGRVSGARPIELPRWPLASLASAAPADCDIVFHASASAAGLATALRLAGEEASVVELSWYGSGDVGAPLGEAFHSRRLRLISSQVGKVAPSHRPRWNHGRRLAAALALLADPVLDVLLAPAIAFADVPASLPALFSADSNAICQLIRYPDETP
jgi:threonine dehydrogenase-like Zn-dependent dehydrogenase